MAPRMLRLPIQAASSFPLFLPAKIWYFTVVRKSQIYLAATAASYSNNCSSLDLHLGETVLPDNDERCSAILAVVHENNHAIGIHRLAGVELVVLEATEDLLCESTAVHLSVILRHNSASKSITYAFFSKSATSSSEAPFVFNASLTFFM